MAATDGQIVVAAARWADEGHYLREFVSKQRLPAVVKIIKGQYGGLGVPTLPSPGLQSTALLISAGKRHKIAAQAVKLKEGRRVAAVGPRLAIPDTYPGYFELLSEEGRAVRCIESVAELARRRLEGGCLVRDPVRALVARVDEDGGVTADGARTVAAGETLVPAGEVTLGKGGRYLRCTDSRGDTVLLGMELRGRFSALAREDNISGVHTARNLLSKRMPLTVRLVHGTPPRGLKSSSHFVPELRLLSAFEEEHVFALPLQQHKEAPTLVALPLAAPLKLQRARNDEQLRALKEFQRLVERSTRLLGDVADRIHVLDGKLGDSKSLLQPRSSGGTTTGYFLRRSASSDSANHHHHHHHHHDHHHHSHSHHGYSRDAENRVPNSHVDDYDEIDQIYDYVRGFAPLPKSIRSPFSGDSPENSTPATPPQSPGAAPPSPPADVDKKPEPPPIETIPGKKLQQKRTRRPPKEPKDKPPPPPALAKLYVKNGAAGTTANSRGLVLRQKSAGGSPPQQQQQQQQQQSVRYKSLSNLQQAMELDDKGGTLDSSHSGGRTSGDSGAGAEKRSRRLSRPRSLTNLVWELRGSNENSSSNNRKHKMTVSGSVAQRRIGTLYL